MNNFIYKSNNYHSLGISACITAGKGWIFIASVYFEPSFPCENVVVHPVRSCASQINFGYHFEGKTGVEKTARRGALWPVLLTIYYYWDGWGM